MMFGSNPGSDMTAKLIPQGSVGVELGVWKGDTTEKFLKRARFVHAVDSWSREPYVDGKEWGTYQSYLDRYSKLTGGNTEAQFDAYYEKIYNQVVNRFKNKPVQIWRMTTDDFFLNWHSKENMGDAIEQGWFDDYPYVDWVYVDASHSYEGCLGDLQLSRMIVKRGCYIFGDDYGSQKPGVKQAVDEFVSETGLQFDNFYLDQYRIRV